MGLEEEREFALASWLEMGYDHSILPIIWLTVLPGTLIMAALVPGDDELPQEDETEELDDMGFYGPWARKT